MSELNTVAHEYVEDFRSDRFMAMLSTGVQNTTIPAGKNIVRLKTPQGVLELFCWDRDFSKTSQVVTGIIASEYASYNFITPTKTYEFLTIETMQLRLNGDVRGWGAKGNGVDDDSLAIQAALDDDINLLDGGNKLFVVTKQLVYGKPKLIQHLNLKYAGNPVAVGHKITSDDVTFIRCKLDGASLTNKIVHVVGTKRFNMSHTTVQNATYLPSLGATGLDAWVVGVYVTGGAREITIEDCIVRDIIAPWSGAEVEDDTEVARGMAFVADGDRPRILSVCRNKFYKMIGGSGVGIHLLSSRVSTYFDSMDFNCNENHFYGFTNRAIKIQASNGNVKNNNVWRGDEYLQDFMTEHGLAGPHQFFNAKSNISVIYSQTVDVSHNMLIALGYTSNLLADGCRLLVATNNRIVNDDLRGTTAQAGMSMTGCQSCRYTGNTIEGGQISVWLLGSSDDNVVADNDCIDPKRYGVSLENDSNDNTVNNNRLSRLTKTPLGCVGITDSSNNLIENNRSNVPEVKVVSVAETAGSPETGVSVGNNLVGNRVLTTLGSVITYSPDTLRDKNIESQNHRMNRHFEVDSWPISYGHYAAGDRVKVRTGEPGTYTEYVCRYAGEYGGQDPIFTKTGLVEVQ